MRTKTLSLPVWPATAVKRRTSRHGRLPSIARMVVLIAFALFFAVPMLWFLLAPTKDNTQLVTMPPLSFGSFEQLGKAWDNLTSFNNGQIFVWARNSVIYVVGSLILSISVCVPAGFALANTDFRWRRPILILTLITMITPGAALTLPLFLELNALRLLNTMVGVILPAGFFPFGVYLAFIYYATAIPREVLDAARVDGCTEFNVFRFIALPLARPVIALIAFFSFVNNWNNFFFPYLILTDDRLYNLPVGLVSLIAGTNALNPGNVGGDLPIKRPEVALAGLLIVLPIAIVFLFSQRFIQNGVLAGATKE